MNKILSKLQKTLFFIIFISILISVFISFEKYFVYKNYEIEIKVECDEKDRSCFIEECADGDSRCKSENIFRFKILQIKGYSYVPLEFCESQNACDVTYCDEENALIYSEKESCSIK